jgi:hypothetical protein
MAQLRQEPSRDQGAGTPRAKLALIEGMNLKLLDLYEEFNQ